MKMNVFFRPAMLCCCLWTLILCKEGNSRAGGLLTFARGLYASGKYAEAEQAIDSISKVAPKAFREINAGLALLDSVRYAENVHTINQGTILLKELMPRIEQEKKHFDFRIDRTDPHYHDNGYYIPKAYYFDADGRHSGLRAGVSGDGRLYIESVADRPLRHISAAVSAPDGQHVETAAVTDDGANYRFDVGSGHVEVVRYTGKRENGLAAFIAAHQGSPLTVTLRGKTAYSFTLPAGAKKAVADAYGLSKLFGEKDSISFEIEKSRRLIHYLDERHAKQIAEKAEKNLKK